MSFTIWFTGMSGSGKSTLSTYVSNLLRLSGSRMELLDGDVIRSLFPGGRGFSMADRENQITHLRLISHFLNRSETVSVVAAITPLESMRTENRRVLDRYVEVFCSCDLDTLVKRDPKGLYARALRGEIKEFTGISSPYEPPAQADVVLDTARLTVLEACDQLMRGLSTSIPEFPWASLVDGATDNATASAPHPVTAARG